MEATQFSMCKHMKELMKNMGVSQQARMTYFVIKRNIYSKSDHIFISV